MIDDRQDTHHEMATAPQPLAWRFAELLLIVMVFIAAAGDPVPGVNEPHYLCRLKHFWNPQWCAGDLFLESPDAHGMFVWCFGWVTQWLSLAATAWVGRALAWFLLAWAWQRLSWRLLPLPLASVLAAALWVTLMETAHLAGEWVVGGVEAKCFAYVFVLAAIREIVDRRWNRACVLLGAACAFHVLVGGWSVVLCAGIWSTVERGAWWRSALDMLPGLLIGGLLSLLGVVPALALTWNESPAVIAEANRIYVFERLPHHLALLTLDADDISRRLIRHALLIVALAALTTANWRRSLCSDGLRIVSRFAWGAVILAAVGFAIELVLWSHPQLAAALLRYYWFRLTDFAVPMAVAFQAIALVAWGVTARKSWAVWALVAVLAFAGLYLALDVFQRWVNPVPPSDARMRDYKAWVDACRWIAENTPANAVFLTPRWNQSFKWRTGRPEVVTRKDIPQDARSMVEWFDRLQNIYPDKVDGEMESGRSPSQFKSAQIAAMARHYGADYVLTDHRQPLELPVVYWNREYAVYAVDR